jgi:lipopolysaccharide export system protein LptA
MPGMPAMAAQTTKQVQCVKKGEGDIKQLMMKEKSCTASDVKSSGSTIEWKMKCDIEGMVTQGKGKVTNKDNSFDGSVETNMTLPQGMSMNTLLKFNGKWLGGC